MTMEIQRSLPRYLLTSVKSITQHHYSTTQDLISIYPKREVCLEPLILQLPISSQTLIQQLSISSQTQAVYSPMPLQDCFLDSQITMELRSLQVVFLVLFFSPKKTNLMKMVMMEEMVV